MPKRDVNPAVEEFVVGTRRYRVGVDGSVWVVSDTHGPVEPVEYLLASHLHLLRRVRELSVAHRSLKALIRRFVNRQATWAELKQAAE